MNQDEYVQLMRCVQAAFPSWKLTADAMEYGERLLASEDFNLALIALDALAIQYSDFNPASLGALKKKIDAIRGNGNSVEDLYVKVVEWLHADEKLRRYWSDWERNYGLDSWDDSERPPALVALDVSVLRAIDAAGGPGDLYDALIVRGDTTRIAQFKKLLNNAIVGSASLQIDSPKRMELS